MSVNHQLYKAIWYWDDYGLSYQISSEDTERLTKQHSRLKQLDSSGYTVIRFQENVDMTKQEIYKQKYQRRVIHNIPNVIRLQDIKDVVTYLHIGHIPKVFLALFHLCELNPFLRSLIVYIQLYLQVLEDLIYRRRSYTHQRLKHPISSKRESLCKTYLSKLRSRVCQEYVLLITGEGVFKRFHHMNNPLNRSYVPQDIMLYDYLFEFSSRVVWIALGRTKYKEIELEIFRLFCHKRITEEKRIITTDSKLYNERHIITISDSDRNVLHGDGRRFKSNLIMQAPIHLDMELNKYTLNYVHLKDNEITGLEVAITLPEELLEKLGVSLGILGKPRANFEAMLHLKQTPPKSLEEKELEKALAIVEEQTDVPTTKMYEYFKELDAIIDLNLIPPHSQMRTIREEIEFYLLTHIQDSKEGYRMWKALKTIKRE